MIITRIVVQRKNKERFSIYVDRGNGEEYGFGVDQDVLIRFQLKKGLEIEESQLTDIIFQDDIKKAYNHSLRYLSYRMRSCKEVNDYLKDKEYEPDVINEVLNRLERHRYVDDFEFAKAFVRTKMQNQSKGPGVIEQELIVKGISNSLIEKALKEYPYDKQIENALKLLQKQVNKGNTRSHNQLKQKISTGLLAKGFSWDIIGEVIDEVNISRDRKEEVAALQYHVTKAQSKYANKYQGWEYEMRIKKYLVQKGFSMDLIDHVLRENEEVEK